MYHDYKEEVSDLWKFFKSVAKGRLGKFGAKVIKGKCTKKEMHLTFKKDDHEFYLSLTLPKENYQGYIGMIYHNAKTKGGNDLNDGGFTLETWTACLEDMVSLLMKLK